MRSTGGVAWLEGPTRPQLHVCLAVGSGRRLYLRSPPRGHSSSLGLDWLPDGHLTSAVPKVREDLQGLLGLGLQNSQHHFPIFYQSKWETSPPRFKRWERNGCVFPGMCTGWQQLLTFRVPKAGWTQGLIPCTGPQGLSMRGPQSPSSSFTYRGFQLDFPWIHLVFNSTHNFSLSLSPHSRPNTGSRLDLHRRTVSRGASEASATLFSTLTS